MKDFLIALQFLTIIPIKIRHIDEKKISKSTIYFPLTGLLLGLILAGANKLLLFLNFEPLFISTILIVLLIVLTGGIHLDGLADTTDALMSGKDREEMLRIMRDSHIGAMGVLSLISIILLKISLLSSINVSLKTAALPLMCILSRWSLVLVMFFFPYARAEGKAKIFMQQTNFKTFVYSTLIALVCSLVIWRLKGLLIIGITGIVTYSIGRYINTRLKGITGDTLGAINELSETFILFSFFLTQKLWII